MPNLERFIEDMQKRLPELDFEGKRLALDMLGITIWLDGQNVEITGTIDPGIVLTRSFAGYSPFGDEVCSLSLTLGVGTQQRDKQKMILGGWVGKDNKE